MIPEEDRGPAWLRDYGHIDIDIDALADIGAKLKFEHGNFVPHLQKVVDDMTTPLPGPKGYFTELVEALHANRRAAQTTVSVLSEQASAIEVMALAAAELGVRYRDADSFAAAQAAVVEQRLADPASGISAQDGGPVAVPVPVPAPDGQNPDLPGGA